MKKSQLKTDSYNWNKRKASTQKHKQKKSFPKIIRKDCKIGSEFPKQR